MCMYPVYIYASVSVETCALPVSAKTAVASVGSSVWRFFLMP